MTATKKKRKYEPWGFDLKVKRSSAGLGLFAGEDIPKGACIIEYVGRELTKEEEETTGSKYLFDLGKGKTIDGNVPYNIAKRINHSCRPNCEAELWHGRAFILARRNIKAGEELGYDYGRDYFNWIMGPNGCRCAKCMEKRKSGCLRSRFTSC